MKRVIHSARTLLLLIVCISLLAISGCADANDQPAASEQPADSTPSAISSTDSPQYTPSFLAPEESPQPSSKEKLNEYFTFIRTLNSLDETEVLAALEALCVLESRFQTTP